MTPKSRDRQLEDVSVKSLLSLLILGAALVVGACNSQPGATGGPSLVPGTSPDASPSEQPMESPLDSPEVLPSDSPAAS